MTDEKLTDLVGSLAQHSREVDQHLAETDRMVKELIRNGKQVDRCLDELAESGKQVDRSFQVLARKNRLTERQLGRLGNKFGSFTEGMAFPSLTRLLERRFKMDVITTRMRSHLNGRTLELDVFAYSKNGDNGNAFIVEIKSYLDERAPAQLRKQLQEFPKFFPGFKGCTLFGILAAVDVPDRIAAEVWQEGFHPAGISDDVFELEVPENFTPCPFQTL